MVVVEFRGRGGGGAMLLSRLEEEKEGELDHHLGWKRWWWKGLGH